MSQVSILIPVYNAASWLHATLASCVRQVGVKEIILADNGSTDESCSIAEKWINEFPELIHLIDASAVKHANYARNLAFSRATGSYIQWLDADDQLMAGKLEQQLAHFLYHPQVDIVYSDWQLDVYDSSRKLLWQEMHVAGVREDFIGSLLQDRWLPPHAYLLRREMAERLAAEHLWNENTAVLQDREYFTCAALMGAEFSYVPGNLVVYNRWSDQSVSQAGIAKRAAAMWQQLKVYDQFYKRRTSRSLYHQKLLNTLLVQTAHQLDLANYDKPAFNLVNWTSIHGLRTRTSCFLHWLFASTSETK